MMFRALAIVVICSFGGSACTTISASPETLKITQMKQRSPVAKMADALVARFADRGWAVRADPARQLGRFAKMLSRGLHKSEVEVKQDPVDLYLAQLRKYDTKHNLQHIIQNEIALAVSETKDLNNHVDVLGARPRDPSMLRTEMLSLEQAVLATRKARQLFVMAAKRSGVSKGALRSELHELYVQIELLTHQTDAINQRRQATNIG